MVKTYWWICLLVGMACLLSVTAYGGPMVATPYGVPLRTFKVCLLLLQSQKNQAGTASYWNADPWILPVLNRSQYKPVGWTLDNPLAPATLPNDTDLQNSAGFPNGYANDAKGKVLYDPTDTAHTDWFYNGKAVGATLTKDDPAYWVVKLDQKSLDALSGYDLLILNGHNESTLSDADKNNLKLLLDRGATIWVNNSQRAGMQLNNFFLDAPLVFNTSPTGYADRNHHTWLSDVDPSNWLLNNVYQLSDTDVAYLRDDQTAYNYIKSGVAGYAGGQNSQIMEVIRLYSDPFVNGMSSVPAGANGKPVIAAGRVGNGQVIATGSDMMGGTSDWWEYQHRHAVSWNKSTLGIAPFNNLPGTANISQPRSYISCCKLIFNMLARPASWHMISGDPLATRFYRQNFAAALAPAWSTPFTTLYDPVSYGNFVAVTGMSGVQSQPQVFQLNDPAAQTAMSTLLVQPAHANGVWVGSPVFSRILPAGLTKPVTVVYALEEYPLAGGDWQICPHCFIVDSGQVGVDAWSLNGNVNPNPLAALTTNSAGAPHPSMTFANGKLVITTFGYSVTEPNHIYMLDAISGILRAGLGSTAEWNAQFRLTGPATLVTARVDFTMLGSEAGDTTPQPGVGAAAINAIQTKSGQVVEMIAVPGEYYPGTTPAGTVRGTPAVFLIPPTLVLQNNGAGTLGTTMVQPTLSLFGIQHGTQNTPQNGILQAIGNFNNPFRKQQIISMRVGQTQDALRITFRNWNIFFPQGTTAVPSVSLPLCVQYSPTGAAQGQKMSIFPLELTMGYPIILQGNQYVNLTARAQSPYRTLPDGDGTDTFGYHVDTPPLVHGDQIVLGTSTAAASLNPFLQDSIGTAQTNIDAGGALTGYRINHPGFSRPDEPLSTNWGGDIAWQFFGDTLGPKKVTLNNYSWQGALPWLWRSDFPYPSAFGTDSLFTVGVYRGTGPFDEAKMSTNVSLPTAANNSMLYALDPAPSRYLEQTVSVGTIANIPVADTNDITLNAYDAARTMYLDESALASALQTALHTGVRAMLQTTTGVWDMGRVTQIRRPTDYNAANPAYWVTFDREAPTGATGASLLIATSVPYVSHVQVWDAVAGAAPMRRYTLTPDGTPANAIPALRVSEGILSSGITAVPGATPANNDVMLSFTQLATASHLWPLALNGTTLTLADSSANLPADMSAVTMRSYLYLQRVPAAAADNTVTDNMSWNYTVDYSTGRIQLAPRAAGQYADRFVMVHYFTNDWVGGTVQPVRHAEIMHVPSPIRWQYQFTDAVPDSGPVVANGTVYVTAMRQTTVGWQPTLYAFTANPVDTQNVQPLNITPVGAVATGVANLPYRGITAPVPTPHGIVVGTAMPGAYADQFMLFADRGLLLADGQRVLRVNGDGQVTWQASATKAFDPNAVQAADAATQGAGVVQQDFSLITKLHRLAVSQVPYYDSTTTPVTSSYDYPQPPAGSGNILLCDTGGNRVVELDGTGTVVWQYPDSDLVTLHQTTAYRLNGPRDVRRYYQENRVVLNNYPLPAGQTTDATVRWETTMIADAGNNRIIEVYRPLVQIDRAFWTANPGVNLGNGYVYNSPIAIPIAPGQGYIYCPGLTTSNGTALVQTDVVLVNGATVKYNDGKGFNALKTLTFTNCLRASGPDGQLLPCLKDHDPVNAPSALSNDMYGVQTNEVLAVVGNPISDPDNTNGFLRVVRLVANAGTVTSPRVTNETPPITSAIRNYALTSVAVAAGAGTTTFTVDYSPEFIVGESVMIVSQNGLLSESLGTVVSTGTPNDNTLVVTTAPTQAYPLGSLILRQRANALQIRTASANDYAAVNQLELVPLYAGDGNGGYKKNAAGNFVQDIHALLVDLTGVREVPLVPANTQQITPYFEMTQTQYAAALGAGDATRWNTLANVQSLTTAQQASLTSWRADTLFAPVAVLRLDTGSLLNSDATKARYLISQMNTIQSPITTTWMSGANGNTAQRRIHLFEARYRTTTTDWGLVDDTGGYFLLPTPWAANFPNLPGATYPLSQPLSIDRD